MRAPPTFSTGLPSSLMSCASGGSTALPSAITLPVASANFLWMMRPSDAAKPPIELIANVPVTMYCSPALATSGFGLPVFQSLIG